jgi:hypothetical protein
MIAQQQMSEPADTTHIPQDQQPVIESTGQTCFSTFLEIIGLNDPALFSLALNLLATTETDQVVCSPSCRRYVVNADTQVMEKEEGVLVSVVLPATQESELAIKAWAIRAAKRIGMDELRIVASEVYEVGMQTQSSDACGFQLSFDDLSSK